MKLKFKNLTEVLAFQLEEMYVAEKAIQKALPRVIRTVSSKKLKIEYKKYLENTSDKRLKLKRIFSYLLIQPIDRKSKVMVKMLDQLQAVAKSKTTGKLKDSQLLSSLGSIAHYKFSVYGMARLFADELELATVAELLSQIISWEEETQLTITRIALEGLVQEAVTLRGGDS